MIFQKNDFDKNKVIIILTGDVVLNRGNQEILHLKHFGSNLLILGSEYYSEMYTYMILDQIGMSSQKHPVKWLQYPDMISELIY